MKLRFTQGLEPDPKLRFEPYKRKSRLNPKNSMENKEILPEDIWNEDKLNGIKQFISSTVENKIPTAEEILNRDYTSTKENAVKAMIEFAKLHVEAALKAACKYNKTSEIMGVIGIDEESVLNAYPLDLIK